MASLDASLGVPYYRLTVDTIVIMGLDIQFEIVKSLKRTLNTAAIKVFNLAEPQRKALSELSIAEKKGVGKIRCELDAGFVETHGLLFRGDLRTAKHERSGPDWVTTIEGDDGGRSQLKAQVSQSFPPGTDVAAVVTYCARALGLGLGNLPSLSLFLKTSVGATFPSGTVLDGQASTELTGILASCGCTWSVQNGALQVLRAGVPLSLVGPLLTPDTGLLDTPSASPDGTVQARCLLLPSITPGARVAIQSSEVSGQFTVQKAKATGDTAGSDWHWDLELK